MGVTYFLLLICLGLAVTAQAQNCSKPVGGLNMSLKDKDIVLQTFPNGTKVTFACDIGYESAGGSGVTTCTAGSWSPVRLKCQRRNCGSPGEMENGHINYLEGTEFGDKIVITCNTGYLMVGRKTTKEIICGAQGWMDRLPVCEVVTCDPPPMVVGGTFSLNKESYDYRDVVQYSCQNGLTLSGSASVSCSDDGTFKPDPPTCTMVQCEDPQIANAQWIEGSRPPYGYKATVKYQCEHGYKMIGQPTQICEINSQWSPGLPTCKLIECEVPDIANADKTEGSGPPYVYKAMVKYQCGYGYKMIGEPTQTCEINGQWSPGLPTCKPVICKQPPMVMGGTFSPNKESYGYRDVVQYSCQKGFTLSGSTSVSCSDDGTFKPDPPTCTMVQCEDPDIANADRIDGSGPPYRYKDMVKYQCRHRYKMIGEPTQICEINGQWSPGLPTCSKGHNIEVVLGVIFGVIGIIGLCVGIYCFGIVRVKRRKQGSGRDCPDNKDSKDQEELALSGQGGQEVISAGQEAGYTQDGPPLMSENNV